MIKEIKLHMNQGLPFLEILDTGNAIFNDFDVNKESILPYKDIGNILRLGRENKMDIKAIPCKRIFSTIDGIIYKSHYD